MNLIKSIPELAAVVEDPTQLPEITTAEIEFSAQGEPVWSTTGEELTDAERVRELPPAEPSVPQEADEVTLPAEDGEGTGANSARATGRWKMTHVTHTHRSYLGQTLFKYHTWAEFNYSGGKVRAWRYRTDDVTNTSDVVDVEGRIVNSKTSVPANSATSYMKRKISLCVLYYGCYARAYPWVKTVVKGSGATSFSSGVS